MNPRDRSTIEASLTVARERLRSLGSLVASDGNGSGADLAVLRAAALAAEVALDDVFSIVADPRDAQRVACPHCSRRVMRDATLCLFCWRRLDMLLGAASLDVASSK